MVNVSNAYMFWVGIMDWLAMYRGIAVTNFRSAQCVFWYKWPHANNHLTGKRTGGGALYIGSVHGDIDCFADIAHVEAVGNQCFFK